MDSCKRACLKIESVRSETLKSVDNLLSTDHKNFVFVGEAGSGKSEIALNFAHYLLEHSDKQVHFFDMDMTKPLFRSRDAFEGLEEAGIVFHFQEQFMDTPTLVGGVKRLLKDDNACVVLDVGGDYIGARAIGGFASELNKKGTAVYYVLNAFRPWSYDIDHIDKTLIDILGASRIQIEQLRLINNPNLGPDTKAEDFKEGCQLMADIVSPFMPIDFACVRKSIVDEIEGDVGLEVMPLQLYLTYPW